MSEELIEGIKLANDYLFGRNEDSSWTTDEDIELISKCQLAIASGQAQGKKSKSKIWKTVALSFPNKIEDSCKKRGKQHASEETISRPIWNDEEDEQLIDVVSTLGMNWDKVSNRILFRSAFKLQERWANLLVNIKPHYWTSEECSALLLSMLKHGTLATTKIPGQNHNDDESSITSPDLSYLAN
jgi:hypothetical protein